MTRMGHGEKPKEGDRSTEITPRGGVPVVGRRHRFGPPFSGEGTEADSSKDTQEMAVDALERELARLREETNEGQTEDEELTRVRQELVLRDDTIARLESELAHRADELLQRTQKLIEVREEQRVLSAELERLTTALEASQEEVERLRGKLRVLRQPPEAG